MIEYDTYENLLVSRLNKALDMHVYKLLLDGNWDSSYVDLFLNLYAQCADLEFFMFTTLETRKSNEPITLHIDPKDTNINHVLHVVSIPYIQSLLDYVNFKEIKSNTMCKFKLPNIFPLQFNEDIPDKDTMLMLKDGINVNANMTKRLINLYVAADHAAYHYKQFKNYRNADYTHTNIIKRSKIERIKEIKHCHDLISNTPNRNIKAYLEQHDILDVQDSNNKDSLLNDTDIFSEEDD
ncbi:PmV-like protein [Macrobrachium rosenbergii nudivirus]|nr:PmV-like protein [Macrobrachium rosenbergii nudivirus]